MKRYAVPFLLACLLLIVVRPAPAQEGNDPDALFDAGVQAYNEKKYDDAVSFWERALPLYKKAADVEHEAMVLNNIGLVYYFTGRYGEAVGYFTKALAIDRKREISKDVATDLQNLGMAYYYIGDYKEALSAYLESAVIFESISDLEGEARNIYNAGKAHFALGNFVEAGRFFSTAADVHRNVRDRAGYALDLMRLGDVYTRLDRFDKAMEAYEEALKVREVLGEREPYVRTEIEIARALENRGRYKEALEYLARAEKDAKDVKSDALSGDLISARGDVLSSSGDWEGALADFDEALALMKKAEDMAGVGMILTDKGILLGDLLRFSEAKKSFEEARLIYQVAGNPTNEAKVLINLGNLTSAWGKPGEALDYYGEAKRLLAKGQSGVVDGVNLMGMGEAYLRGGEYKKARAALTEAGRLVADERDRRYLSKIDAYVGLLDYREGNYASALSRFNDSLAILRKENDKTLVADILLAVGMALMKTGRPEVAAGYFLEAKRLADDLAISPIGWRAVYADGLVKEGAGDDVMALARLQDGLFRFASVPEVAPSLYGSRVITPDDLFDGLIAAYVKKGDKAGADAAKNKGVAMGKIVSLFTGAPPQLPEKEQELLTRLTDAVGEVSYLLRRLADDQYRKGDNTDVFVTKIRGAEGDYLKALDDIRDDAPELWNAYFRDVYE